MKNIIAIAPPCAFSTWALARLEAAGALCATAPKMRYVGHDENITEAEIVADAGGTIFVLRAPNSEIEQAVVRGDVRCLILFDEPLQLVLYLQRTSGFTTLQAIRTQTASLAIAPVLRLAEDAIKLHYQPNQTVRDVETQIVAALPNPPSASALEEFFSANGADTTMDQVQFAGLPLDEQKHFKHSVDAAEREMIVQALSPLMHMAYSKNVPPVKWMNGLFLSFDNKGQVAPLAIEIMGPARAIYFGPYLYLPAGDWSVNFVVGFSKDVVNLPLFFRVLARSAVVLAAGHFVGPAEGVYSGSLLLSHKKSADVLEIQFGTGQGALEGRIALAYVEFTYLSS